jgi:ATP-dependent Clp protease adaptor protein ClpS
MNDKMRVIFLLEPGFGTDGSSTMGKTPMRIIGELQVVDAPVIQKTGLGDSDLEGMAQIVLYNDDVNSFEHVVMALKDVFSHSVELASKLALEAHKNGRTIAEVEGKSEAIRHKEQLVSYGITAEVEPI